MKKRELDFNGNKLIGVKFNIFRERNDVYQVEITLFFNPKIDCNLMLEKFRELTTQLLDKYLIVTWKDELNNSIEITFTGDDNFVFSELNKTIFNLINTAKILIDKYKEDRPREIILKEEKSIIDDSDI